jgi:choline-glycine betaine transporter
MQSETSSVYVCFRKLTIVRVDIICAGLPCISVILTVLYVRVFHKNMEKEERKKKETCVEIIAHAATPSG